MILIEGKFWLKIPVEVGNNRHIDDKSLSNGFLNFDLFRNFQGVIYIDTEIPNSTFKLGMAK